MPACLPACQPLLCAHSSPVLRSLGANDFQVFWNVTLPNIRWGLLYGIILTNAVSPSRCGVCLHFGGPGAGALRPLPAAKKHKHLQRQRCAYHTCASPRPGPGQLHTHAHNPPRRRMCLPSARNG
jgi:hypothetical protein